MAVTVKTDRQVVYLYGITESKPRHIPELFGVDRLAKVEAIECAGVFCWISRVPALDFKDNFEQNMENLEWLAEASVAHQRVIGAISGEAEILPARLGTVFASEASLCNDVSKRTQSLRNDFARIQGADEWGIKVFQLEPAITKVAKVRSGRDYLKAKAALLPMRRNKKEDGEEISRLGRALERVATETAPGGKVSRGQRGLAFQTTLLVPRSKRRKLESLLEEFAREWKSERRIECTGPWPPYSFVSRANGAKAR